MKQFWKWVTESEAVEAYLFMIGLVCFSAVVFLTLLVATKGTIIIPLVFVLLYLVYKKYKEETSDNQGEH